MSESPSLDAQAARLSAALDAIEAALEALELSTDPDAVAAALAGPVRAFDTAAKEALP
ncbi:MAG: hypothetical protein JNM59_06090 [Hyphomonadaceae bacterium]|nr:hypothetical protein [Hyphomonadaceae bacterium]